jgi:hypothetical protein
VIPIIEGMFANTFQARVPESGCGTDRPVVTPKAPPNTTVDMQPPTIQGSTTIVAAVATIPPLQLWPAPVAAFSDDKLILPLQGTLAIQRLLISLLDSVRQQQVPRRRRIVIPVEQLRTISPLSPNKALLRSSLGQ